MCKNQRVHNRLCDVSPVSRKTDQHYLDVAPAPRACPTEPVWHSACCRPSWACRCPGNSSRIGAGVAVLAASASLYRCWL